MDKKESKILRLLDGSKGEGNFLYSVVGVYFRIEFFRGWIIKFMCGIEYKMEWKIRSCIIEKKLVLFFGVVFIFVLCIWRVS